MTTLVTWKGDGLSNGSLTTSSVGTGDTAPSAVNGGSALTVADSTVGTRDPVIRIQQVAGAGASVYWNFTATTTPGVRVYWTPTSSIATNHTVVRLFDTVANAQVILVNVTDTGRVNVYNAASALVAQSSTGLISAGVRHRIEATVNCTTDTIAVKVFVNESTSPIVSLTNTSNYGAQANRVQLGNYLTTPTSEVQEFDDLIVNDAGTFPGPVAGALTLSVASTDTVLIDASGSSAGGGGALTYSITQTSGTTTTPRLLDPGVWTVQQHPTDSLVYSVTVSEAGGSSSSQSVTVSPPGSASSGDAVEIVQRVSGAWV